jgi:catechol 2,3-dioxygenase-like lactoylglutathione lyase family enzyme
MRETQAALASATDAGRPSPRFHHVGIQTTDLANSIRFYEDFLGCTRAWTLDRFSELTLQRLPGIAALAEMVLGDTRFHLFERPGAAADPATSSSEFQHL